MNKHKNQSSSLPQAPGSNSSDASSNQQPMGKKGLDWLQKNIPDPVAALKHIRSTPDELKSAATFCFDTNVLISPLERSEEFLHSTETALNRLKREKRILQSVHVLREFIRRRGAKLQEFHKELNQNLISFSFTPTASVPIVEKDDSFIELVKTESEIVKLMETRGKLIKELQNKISHWNWADHVSELYRRIFTQDIVIGTALELDELTSIYESTKQEKLPPLTVGGDASNGGVGDFIVWQDLLEIGRKSTGPVVFVTNEKKEDWFNCYSVGDDKRKYPVTPRDELILQYRKETGKDIHLISLANFLEWMGAQDSVVKEAAAATHDEQNGDVEYGSTNVTKILDLILHDLKQIGKILGESSLFEIPLDKLSYRRHRIVKWHAELIGVIVGVALSEDVRWRIESLGEHLGQLARMIRHLESLLEDVENLSVRKNVEIFNEIVHLNRAAIAICMKIRTMTEVI